MPYFNVNKHEISRVKGYDAYTIHGSFESHETGNLFDRISSREQRNYFRRAETRKRKLLAGWKSLADITEDYIRKVLKLEPRALPFVETR